MTALTPSPLGDKMRALAKSGHERADDLERLAHDMEVKAGGYYAEEQTVTAKQFVGAWARARRCWSECSGEPLL